MKTKLNVLFARFPYGMIEHPGGTDWLIGTLDIVRQNPLIGMIKTKWSSGTPITMLRNKMVKNAIDEDIDILVMLDNDMIPHYDFFINAFKFFYHRYDDAPSVIASPYCGAPPYENVFAFRWEEYSGDNPENSHKLLGINRNEVSQLTGIQPMAAVATGCVFIDMRIFTGFRGIKLPLPWFYYEYTDAYCQDVKSTEDITWSRNIGALYKAALGLDALFIDWDSWATHCKRKNVEKPTNEYPKNIKSLFERVVGDPTVIPIEGDTWQYSTE